MMGWGVAFALGSAASQAIAHAMLKGGQDKLVIRGFIGLTCATLVVPFVAFVPLPNAQLWSWLALACALHTVYQLVLIRAYDAADFSLVYPLARGAVPVSTCMMGLVLLGDKLAPSAIAGVVLVTTGLLCLAFRNRLPWAALAYALGAGLLTTSYTVVDGHAVRLAPLAATFIVWFFILDGAMMFPLACLARGSRIGALLKAEGRYGVLAGIASFITYGAALVALKLLPVGAASALRETGVVFGLPLAALVLKEEIGWQRIGGALLVALGGMAIALSL